jgi:hypothetical protein
LSFHGAAPYLAYQFSGDLVISRNDAFVTVCTCLS